MAEKNKIRAEYARRYRKAKKTEKTKILDESWDEKQPGFCEIDTVSHDRGGKISPYYA